MNDYNSEVMKSSRVQVLLILLLLITLILSPRPLTGAVDLASAQKLEVAGNSGGAASAYASAAERLPWIPSLWERAGEASFLDHNGRNSIIFFKKAIARGTISKLGWLELGNAFQQRGDISFALNAWEQALPLAEAYGNLAQEQQKVGNFQAAIENWQANVDQEPGNANAHYQLGLLYAATNPSKALPELMLTVKLNPDLDRTLQGLREALNTAFLSDNNAYHFLVSGRALAALGKWDLATEAFHHAVYVNEGYAEAWAWLAMAKQQQGQDGTFEVTRAITLDPGAAIVQGLYGMYLEHEGKSKEALPAFQKAASLESSNPIWQMALGNTFEQTGDLISAYSHYLHAVELAPEDPSTWRALATFSVNNGVDVDTTGISAARKLVELSPDDWYSYDLAGQAALLLYDYSAAEDYLNKAVRLAPTEAAPVLHLGLAYLQSGVLSSASSYLNLAKVLDPNGPYGQQATRILEQYFP